MGPPGAARSDGPSVPVANFTDGRRLTIGTREWPSKCQADEAHFPRHRQARDHAGARCLAQERRRWPRALNAPPSAAAPPSDLAESPPRESTTGPAAASVAPTIAAPPPADRRPASSSRFRRAHILLDLKYNGSWRGNDKRYFTGRDAEVLPYPLPHRRRDMPPEPLRHSAPNGPEHVSVDFAAAPPLR